MTIPKLTPYTGPVANPDGSQTQTEFTQNMFGQLSYEAQLATELDATIDGMNQAVTDVENNAAAASASATAAEASASTVGYQGLWPDTGGSANKGDTYQTQVGGTPTGEYYTALQNTTVDPVGDNVNWKANNDYGSVSGGGLVVKHRRGTAAEIAACTPDIGELLLNTTDNSIHMGDGAIQGGIKHLNTNVLADYAFRTIDTVSSFQSLMAPVGASVKPLGFHVKGDFINHPGFKVKSGSVTEVSGRLYNLANGNHAEILSDENSVNVNWIGVNQSRTGAQNALSVSNYLSEIGSGLHTLFFHEDIEINELEITRDDTSLITNRKAKISSSTDYSIMPSCSNFKMKGFRTPDDHDSRLVYLDFNSQQVKNHEYEDIKVSPASPTTKEVVLFSTFNGGQGWDDISFTRVRGYTDQTATAALIKMDHGNTSGIECKDVRLFKCHSEGYAGVVVTAGNEFCEGLEVVSCRSVKANGRPITTYHTRGGLVVKNNFFSEARRPAYLWCGVVTSSERPGAVIQGNRFEKCSSTATNPTTGLPEAHGALYEQAQRANISGNIYNDNLGTGYVIGAGCATDNISNENSSNNEFGCVICSDAGGITSRIRSVTLTNCHHSANRQDSVLIAGRVDRVYIVGGNHKSNCTGNAALNTGQSSIRYSKTHTENDGSGGGIESNPQLNHLKVIGALLGVPKLGTVDIDSYPEHSININGTGQTSLIIGGACQMSALTSEIKFNTPSPTGSRIITQGNLKESSSSVDWLDPSNDTPSVYVNSENYDWDGNSVV